MARELAKQAFLALALHAKMHKQLDKLEEHRQATIQRIEEREILAYDNDREFQQLEELKKELLAISFVG